MWKVWDRYEMLSKRQVLQREKRTKIFKHRNSYKHNKKRFNMEWLYGIGALFFGGSSLLLFFQQVFLMSLGFFMVAVILAYMLEKTAQ